MPTITPATYTFSSGLRGFSPEQQDAYKKALSDERLNAIVQRNPSIERFIRLAVVSSPTVRPGHPKEQEMKRNIQQIRELTAEIFKELDKNITTYTDEYGSLIIKVPGSPGYEGAGESQTHADACDWRQGDRCGNSKWQAANP